ncbi:MAG: hypothetical protein ACOY82_06290 [Pseudomonadota bacterium]
MRPAIHRPVALVVLLGLALPAQARLIAVEGDARDPDNDRLFYRESHLVRHEGERPVERLVLYSCPDGTAFARKRVDYRESALAPAFELIDARGYREGLRRERGRTLVWSGETAPRAIATGAAPLVADAGFDEFLRLRWPRLTAGEAQPLTFAVPAFGRSLPFKVRNTGLRREGDDRVQRFELRLDGLLGRVAGAIRVDYDAADRRLRRFTGPTNIRDARGEQIEARIEFPRPPRPVDAQAWETAMGRPLARCALGR